MLSNLYEELKTLIYSSEKKENECRAYLEYAENLLFKRPGSGIECDIEYRGHRGNTDYIISGVGNISGADLKLAFIWELKAPQCFVFERDPSSTNRLIPSRELLQAENQLLNYYDELKYSSDFLEEHEITHSQYVLIGGIIIGCDKTMVDSTDSETEKDREYRKALRCRQYFYRTENVELFLWNRILDHLKQPDLQVQTHSTPL